MHEIEHGFMIVKAFRIFTGKKMVNGFLIVCKFGIVSVFGIWYGYMIIKAIRLFIEKGMVNEYWMVCVFW